MKTKNRSVVYWPLIVWCLVSATVLAACGVSEGATITVTPVPTETPSLRLEDGAVEMQDEHHTWVPIAGVTTFDLIGKLQSTDPWMVTGNTFAVRDFTQIAEGLKVGDQVEVKGVILEDATWLAVSIQLAKEKNYPMVILTGKVNSIDPWVVSGIRLNVTVDTSIPDKITPDMIARVGILLLADGRWDVVSIVPLSAFTEIPGCDTVAATVARVNGNEVQFAGWPALSLGKDVMVEDEAGNQVTLSVNRSVLIVVCSTGGQFMITKIVVLRKNGDPTGNGGRVMICHKPNKRGGRTVSISVAAAPAYLRHGDKPGSCTRCL